MTWHLWGTKPAKHWRELKALSELLLVDAEVQRNAPAVLYGCRRALRWVLLRLSSSQSPTAPANGRFLFSRYHYEIRKCFHFILKCYFQFLGGTEKLNDPLKVTGGVFGKMQKEPMLQPAALITAHLFFGTNSVVVVIIKMHYPRYFSCLLFLMKFICSSYQLTVTPSHVYQCRQSAACNLFSLFFFLVVLHLICSFDHWKVRYNPFLMIVWF